MAQNSESLALSAAPQNGRGITTGNAGEPYGSSLYPTDRMVPLVILKYISFLLLSEVVHRR